jgi:hypothetical protein
MLMFWMVRAPLGLGSTTLYGGGRFGADMLLAALSLAASRPPPLPSLLRLSSSPPASRPTVQYYRGLQLPHGRSHYRDHQCV